MFRTHPCGFEVKLAGGTVSCDFGYGSFSDNGENEDKSEVMESKNTEIAVLDDARKFITKEVWLAVFGKKLDDDVACWCSPEDFAKVAQYLSV